MATKNQLKGYFKTGRIPTQTQFATLIDFIQPLVSDDIRFRNNRTLLFGDDGTNPVVNGFRTVHYRGTGNDVHNYWIFTNEALDNNHLGISIPMFVIKRISSVEPNLLQDNPNLEYAIPTREQLTDWVQQHYNCDTDNDASLHLALTHFTFKPWLEGGGSEFSRIVYINSQSDWDTWITKFKAAHPEANKSDRSNSSTSNHWIIDSYIFIIGRPNGINFATNTDKYKFFNCTITNNGFIDSSIILDFTRCAFENCYLHSGFSITSGDFNSCSFNIDGNIDMCTIYHSNLNGVGTATDCGITESDIKFMKIRPGSATNCNMYQCRIDGAEIDYCRLHSCTILSAKLTSNFIEMIGCNIPHDPLYKNAFKNSATEIKGFIFGCDFIALESIPGVMKGVQSCTFKAAISDAIYPGYFD